MKRSLNCLALLLLATGLIFFGDACWIKAKVLLGQHLLRHSWEKTVKTGQVHKPWPWADSWPVARLRFQRLTVDLIVLEGDSGEVLAFGPGHLTKSYNVGEKGNCILAGHRDTSFSFLEDLVPGDNIELEDNRGRVHFYQVRSSEVVEADKLYFGEDNHAWLTLVTCYPFQAVLSGGPLRFLVYAEKVV